MSATFASTGVVEFIGEPAADSQSRRVTTPPVNAIDPLAADAWDRAVASHPRATIFHSSAWAKVLNQTYGHTPHYLRFGEGENATTLVPIMEVKSAITGRRGVCLPFSDFCGPLFFGGDILSPAIVDHLTVFVRERGWKYLELRSALPAEMEAAVYDRFYGHRLGLTKSPDELFEAFDSSVRRAIRKAERSALTVEIATDLPAIRHFYRLHNQTRRRHGIPPQPFAFFRNIYRHILERGAGFIVLARLNAQPVAAAIFFHFGTQALFKFGASDDRQQEHRPNNLVMWEGIQRCAQLGMKSLSLGRTDFEHTGLRRFKLSMGAEEEVLHYHRLSTASGRWMNARPSRSSQISGAVFRRLPLTVNMLAGTVLYPHLH